MLNQKNYRNLILASLILFLTACTPGTNQVNNDLFFAPTAAPNQAAGRQPSPTTASPTPTIAAPTATAMPIQLTATVWESIPITPVLMYHRFDPRPDGNSQSFTTALTDFDQQLQTLYDAGFSLVALDDWLIGKIEIPTGRRPLIITFDDLFYADQISLDNSGQPASYSGIGRLWQFWQNHPDFGFHAALFFNLGDKPYANHYEDGKFFVEDGWRTDRARAIAWGIQNDALPYNHFYEHPFLNTLSPEEIQWQLAENDRALREALSLVGEEALAQDLPNILALPYVIWPETEEGRSVLYQYRTPEGTPVSAILEGDYAANAKLFPAPFSADFDPWHVPRMVGNQEAIDIILSQIEEIPTANTCDLGALPPDSLTKNSDELPHAILTKTADGSCPMGYYIVENFIFLVEENGITQISPLTDPS